MPIVNAADLLEHARGNGYAIASFKPVNLETLAGLLDAAERTDAPVILAPAARPDAAVDLELLMPAVVAAARRCAAPVAIQLDGCVSKDDVIRAMGLGANAVGLAPEMQDAPAASAGAHECGVAVEGAISAGIRIEQATAYSAAARVGALGVIASEDQRIDRDWLKALVEAAELPLAIPAAGALPATSYRSLREAGAVRFGFDDLADRALARLIGSNDPRDPANSTARFAQELRTATGEDAARVLQSLDAAGAGGKALGACRPWREVEHLIIYNVDPELGEDDVNAMMARGRTELSGIPGVRRVATGRAVTKEAQYQFCWLVRFCDAAVIPTYRDHPTHVEFADQVFRPVAGNRISIDYELED